MNNYGGHVGADGSTYVPFNLPHVGTDTIDNTVCGAPLKDHSLLQKAVNYIEEKCGGNNPNVLIYGPYDEILQLGDGGVATYYLYREKDNKLFLANNGSLDISANYHQAQLPYAIECDVDAGLPDANVVTLNNVHQGFFMWKGYVLAVQCYPSGHYGDADLLHMAMPPTFPQDVKLSSDGTGISQSYLSGTVPKGTPITWASFADYSMPSDWTPNDLD